MVADLSTGHTGQDKRWTFESRPVDLWLVAEVSARVTLLLLDAGPDVSHREEQGLGINRGSQQADTLGTPDEGSANTVTRARCMTAHRHGLGTKEHPEHR